MKHQILSRQTVLTAHAFNVEKVDIKLPNEAVVRYDLVSHTPAVVIIPVTDEGNILFVRQFRLGAEKEILELPAGVINAGEHPDASAERELQEETGYASANMIYLGGFFMAAGYSTEYLYIYLARNLSWSPLPQDTDEFLEPISMPIEEAFIMAENAEFEDSKTFASLMMAQKFIRRR